MVLASYFIKKKTFFEKMVKPQKVVFLALFEAFAHFGAFSQGYFFKKSILKRKPDPLHFVRELQFSNFKSPSPPSHFSIWVQTK